MDAPPLVVPARFRGPARSGNGGWSAGALAQRLPGAPVDHDAAWPPVRVRLTSPPPLDTEVAVDVEGRTATCAFGTAQIADQAPVPVAGVPPAVARAAKAAYAGLRTHPFPTCVACGTDRPDGLRIFPGPVDDRRVAATWTPSPDTTEDWHAYRGDPPRASLPVTWAAVDCVGGWAGEVGTRPMVLGQITCAVVALSAVGEQHVVVGERRGAEGRRTLTAATLYDAAGAVVATAEHVWVTVDPSAFNNL